MMSKWAGRIIRTRTVGSPTLSSDDDNDPVATVVDGATKESNRDPSTSDSDESPAAQTIPDSVSNSPTAFDGDKVLNETPPILRGKDSTTDNEQEVEVDPDDEENEKDGEPDKVAEVAANGIVDKVDNSGNKDDSDPNGSKDDGDPKKRIAKKRLVGSHSSSIKQMKDAVVRTQAAIAASKVSTIQSMTSYATVMQANNNPRSDTFLLNYDEIVERPDKMSEGERARITPKWTVLVPKGTREKEIGAELEKLGKAMQEEKKRAGKKLKSNKFEKKDFLYDCVDTHEKYLESVYGIKPGPKNKKQKL